MAGAKATLQRQDVLANNLANASTDGFRAEMQAFRAVPVRGDGASTRVYALETTRRLRRTDPARCRPPAATSTSRCRATPGSRCRRLTAPRPTPAPARCEVDAEGLLVTPQRPAGAGRRRPDHRAGQCRGDDRRPTARSPPTVGNGAPQPARPAQAGDARGAADARRRRPVPRRRRRDLPADADARGCRPARWRAATSTRSRPMVGMIAAARQFEQQMKMLQRPSRTRTGGHASCCRRSSGRPRPVPGALASKKRRLPALFAASAASVAAIMCGTAP